MTKNALEWTVFAVSLGLVAAAVGTLVYESVSSSSEPLQLTVRTGTVSRVGQWWRVPVTVTNSGDETAEGAEIVVALERDGNEVERSQFHVSYIPRHSERSGAVIFRRDPSCCELTARTIGYETP